MTARLLRQLARDDRLETWLADDDGQRVVVERLRAELSLDAAAVVARVRAMGRAPHAGLERARSFSLDPPTWVFASDDAVPLADLVRMGGGGAPAEVALVVVRAVAGALAALDDEVRGERAGRPRLALPPERVRIGRDTGVRLQDPGFLAVLGLLDGGARGADRAFAAPELLRAAASPGANVGERAEVFALGALLHQLVAERSAWAPDAGRVELDEHLEADVRAIVAQALSPSPAERPGWPTFLAALDGALTERGVDDHGAALAEWLGEVAASRVVEVDRRPDPFDAEAWLVELTAARVEEGTAARPRRSPRRATERLGTPSAPDATTTLGGARAAGWDEETTPAEPPTRGAPAALAEEPAEAPARTEIVSGRRRVVDDPMLGLSLHGYRLESALGNGAFSRVYLGRHLHLDRRAAIKVLRGSLAGSKVARRRMAREANALAGLRHPNLVALLDFGLAPSGLPFLITELLEGRTLEWAMKHEPRRSAGAVARLGAQIARGLAAAHAVGIVHRDLKPANVMLVGDDLVKVLDFGVARMNDGPTRLTELDALVGTPWYMAPEQIRGASAVGASADLYSLGVLLFHVVTGQPPFVGNVGEVIDAHLHRPPPALPVLGGLERVIVQLLAKDPAARPASAEAAALALEALSGPVGGRSADRALSSPPVTAPAVADATMPPPVSGTHPRAPAQALHVEAPSPSLRRARVEAWAALALAVGALVLAIWRR